MRSPGEEWKPDFMWIAFYGYDQYIRNTTDFLLAVQGKSYRRLLGPTRKSLTDIRDLEYQNLSLITLICVKM